MSDMFSPVSRRAILAGGMGLAATGFFGPASAATLRRSVRVPSTFLWGASTAAHQIEGNNVNSDMWLVENLTPTIFSERSGDACDSYHRFDEDIAILASLGLNTYRFSIEWARIETDRGHISNAEIDHYKQVIESCHRHGVKPAVTFHHFSSPRWFAASGGWKNPDSPKFFADYCRAAASQLASGMEMAFTLNEPDGIRQAKWFPGAGMEQFKSFVTAVSAKAAKASGSETFSFWFDFDADRMTPNLLAAHSQGLQAIKSARSDLPVGVCLALADYQGIGAGNRAEEARRDVDQMWFAAAKAGDFIGVQNYTRSLIGSAGPLPPPAGAPLSTMGQEVYPPSLGHVVRWAHDQTGLPVLVTENGIATDDDDARSRYLDAVLAGLGSAMDSGVPVLGYLHWSLLDNYEWMFGFKQHYGLVAVDRSNFVRTPKASAAHYAAIVKGGAV